MGIHGILDAIIVGDIRLINEGDACAVRPTRGVKTLVFVTFS